MICKGCKEVNGGICRDCYKWQDGELNTGKEYSLQHIENLRGNNAWSTLLNKIEQEKKNERADD